MRIDQLCLDNLGDGVYCPHGACLSRRGDGKLDAWLDGNTLRGRVAKDENGQTLGFVLYYPIEAAPTPDGDGMYMVQCLQVAPVADKGEVAKALIESAISDAFENGSARLITNGLANEEGLEATFLHNRGLNENQAHGLTSLYFIVFSDDTSNGSHSKLRVDVVDCQKCYAGANQEQTIQQVVETSPIKGATTRRPGSEAAVDHYLASGVFVDGKLVYFTGPASEDELIDALQVADSARRRAMDR
ncbi:MAG: hypothetical protein GX141_01520 [Armatimonadetes bacterium]|nr:hypothetical protein [Armatimonadota bacterium]